MAAAAINFSSSSLTQPTVLLQSQKHNEGILFKNGGEGGASGLSVKKTSLLPIRCRFGRPYTNPPFSWRRGGVAGNLDATSSMTSTGVPTSVPVRVAHELLQAGHRYLDVRTPEEFSAGHVPGSVNIPYLYRVGSGMTKNPHFLAQVSSQFRKDDEILIGCQSGKRSLMAVNDLQSAGYTGIIDVAGGYGAWTQSELPAEV